MSRTLAQAKFDIGNWLRNGEQALLNVLFPLAALAGSTRLDISGDTRAALLILFTIGASSFTSVSIATAFDRRAGALKVYGISPLGRRGFVQARILSALVVTVMQILVLSGLAYVSHIEFTVSGLLLACAGLSVVTWNCLALVFASLFRAEAVLALANLVFIGATALMWWSVTQPSTVAWASPMSAGFLAASGDQSALIATIVWSVTSLVIAIKTFRWE